MNDKPKRPIVEDFIIDVNNSDELNYIATKFGCTTGDIILAIETTKSNKRSKVYPWLVDYTFKRRI